MVYVSVFGCVKILIIYNSSSDPITNREWCILHITPIYTSSIQFYTKVDGCTNGINYTQLNLSSLVIANTTLHLKDNVYLVFM